MAPVHRLGLYGDIPVGNTLYVLHRTNLPSWTTALDRVFRAYPVTRYMARVFLYPAPHYYPGITMLTRVSGWLPVFWKLEQCDGHDRQIMNQHRKSLALGASKGWLQTTWTKELRSL